MSSAADVPPARGSRIAWPIFALALAAAVLIGALAFAVTFNGPPPDRVPGAERIARALRTGRPQPGPGPAETTSTVASSPIAPHELSADAAAVVELAAAMRVPAADLVGYTSRHHQPGGNPFFADYLYAWNTAGGWRTVSAPRPPLLMPWHRVTLFSILGALGVLAFGAWGMARAISRPLERLAAAAARVRPGAPLAPLPLSGSREVRALAQAVGGMHARLAGHARGRTAMLAAIAHDLGTPLSRLAFRVEGLPEAQRDRATADIAEMREMIAVALRFARDELALVGAARVDLESLLDSIATDMAEQGALVTLASGPPTIVLGDAAALRRLFRNLIENAVRYGERARIGWERAEAGVFVTIDDDGPGVDLAEAESLFEPFVRGERSRNRATGGTGLGLAIARSIAERHGGTVMLRNRDGGGRACVTLPVSD